MSEAEATPATRKCRWSAFSLLTMLVVVTVVCCGIVWTAYQLNWIRQRHDALHGLTQSQRAFMLDWSSSFVHEPDNKLPWPLRLFGEESMRQIIVRDGQESELGPLRVLFPESEVTADETRLRGSSPIVPRPATSAP